MCVGSMSIWTEWVQWTRGRSPSVPLCPQGPATNLRTHLLTGMRQTSAYYLSEVTRPVDQFFACNKRGYAKSEKCSKWSIAVYRICAKWPAITPQSMDHKSNHYGESRLWQPISAWMRLSSLPRYKELWRTSKKIDFSKESASDLRCTVMCNVLWVWWG